MVEVTVRVLGSKYRMRTFKQYLYENPETLSDLLRQECPGFLKRIKNGFLYRGTHNPGKNIGKFALSNGQLAIVNRKTVRSDRKPTDTNPQLHRALDKWFENKFGFKARSAAAFCFGEKARESTMAYGAAYLAFPVGRFSYVWSPKVADLFNQIGSDLMTGSMFDKQSIRKEYLNGSGSVDMDALDDYMSQWEYTNNNLDQAVLRDGEIMVDASEMLLIPYHAPTHGDDSNLATIQSIKREVQMVLTFSDQYSERQNQHKLDQKEREYEKSKKLYSDAAKEFADKEF